MKELEEMFLLHGNAQLRCSSVLRVTKPVGFNLQRDMTELRMICVMSGGMGGSRFFTDEWSKEFCSNRLWLRINVPSIGPQGD